MPWEHSFDQILWSGGRTQDHTNDSVYEPQDIKDFLFQYITDTDEKPSVEQVMCELDLPDEQYDDVMIELRIYNHEEEVDFRESVPGHPQTT